jgi:hypothetical protein
MIRPAAAPLGAAEGSLGVVAAGRGLLPSSVDRIFY